MANLFGVPVKRAFDPITGKCDAIEAKYPGRGVFTPSTQNLSRRAIHRLNKTFGLVPPKHPETVSTILARINRISKWRARKEA